MKVRWFDAWIGIGVLISRQAWDTWMLRMAMLHNACDMRMRAFVIPQVGVIDTHRIVEQRPQVRRKQTPGQSTLCIT